MFRFLRVNMAAKTCVFEDIPEEYAGLGGRALTSTIVAREVNPICTPLGPHNKLVFAPGLLGATNSPNGNRISVGCKSPLTEGIKESNSGGQPGGHLAKLGIMAIIVEDMATEGEWWQLELSKDSAKLVPSTVAGLNNFDAVAKLVETYGDKCSYVTIGRAGEFKLTAASIAFTDRELRPMRHAGRGGVGAVMGSKGLKAIIINPEGGKNHPLADEKAFREASKRFAKALTEHPITGKGLAEYGTGVLVNILHEAGGLPTANFTVGQFDKHEGVSGETMNRLTKERGGEGAVAHGCMSGCIIRCSGLFPDKQGKIAQKTEDLVGPYELHDFFLYNFLRAGYGPAKILLLAEQAFDGSYDRAAILRWLTVFVRRFFTQQFKRSAMPDGPKVGSVTLSPRGDWRMPSDASAAAWLRELDTL